MSGGLLTIGESMALLSNDRPGRLRHVDSLRLGFAGAESNVAIGVSRLGQSAAWVGRVGDDEFGELILTGIRGEGVDVSGAHCDPSVPTSLMVKERLTSSITRVQYYRRGGPGSRLVPEDLDASAVAAAGVLHVTGITPALSESARQTIRSAISTARQAGVAVSLDYNYRAALWSGDEAAAELGELTADADIVFAGESEAELVARTADPREQAVAIAAMGPARVVIKRGEQGALASIHGEIVEVAPVVVQMMDAVGAGDAFVAGYLAEFLAGADDTVCLQTAAACGALAVTTFGDWEGMPFRADLGMLRSAPGTVVR